MKNQSALYISNSDKFSQISSVGDEENIGIHGVMSSTGVDNTTSEIGTGHLVGYISYIGATRYGGYFATFRLGNIGDTDQLLNTATGATFVGEVG